VATKLLFLHLEKYINPSYGTSLKLRNNQQQSPIKSTNNNNNDRLTAFDPGQPG